MRRLQYLSVSGNELTGTMPPELGDLEQLHWIFLWGNQLSGSIPEEIGDLERLFTLYLHDNQLEGSLPRQLADITELSYLRVDENPALTGPIPLEFLTLWLNRFHWNDTGLCSPDSAQFRAWLESIDEHEAGPICDSGSGGGIAGRVSVGSEGLEGVTVSLTGGPEGTDASVTTNASGQYAFVGLRAAGYAVGISGYDTSHYEFEVTSQDVTVAQGQTVTVNFEGRVGGGSGDCAVGQVLNPGSSCTYSGGTFEVLSNGCVRLSGLGSGTLCAQSINYNGFQASRQSGNVGASTPCPAAAATGRLRRWAPSRPGR